MAGRKPKSKAEKSNNTGTSTSSTHTAQKPNSPGPPNGHDYSWLKEKTLPLVHDPELHQKSLVVLKALEAQQIDFGRFVWGVNWGNNASRDFDEMQQARSSFRGKYLIPTLHNI
ncbi:hypothetical protein FS749_010278 [Ceratobasidium sp. UAMH 11750]|nr:hypothetical protein FS749_010278 [Ceratobasidium sp. UAMH 11750]